MTWKLLQLMILNIFFCTHLFLFEKLFSSLTSNIIQNNRRAQKFFAGCAKEV